MAHLLFTCLQKQDQLVFYGYIREIQSLIKYSIIPTSIIEICDLYRNHQHSNHDILHQIFYGLTKQIKTTIFVNWNYILTEFNASQISPNFSSISQAKKWNYHKSIDIQQQERAYKYLYSVHSNRELLASISKFIHWIYDNENASYSLSRICGQICGKFDNDYILFCKYVNLICMNMMMNAIKYKHGYSVYDKIKILLFIMYKHYQYQMEIFGSNKKQKQLNNNKTGNMDETEKWIKGLLNDDYNDDEDKYKEIEEETIKNKDDIMYVYKTKFIETRDFICDKYGNQAFNDSVHILKCVEKYYNEKMNFC